MSNGTVAFSETTPTSPKFSVYISIFRDGSDAAPFVTVEQTLGTLDDALAIARTHNAPRRFAKTLQGLYDGEGGMVVYKDKKGLTFCAQLDDPGHLGGRFEQENLNLLVPGEMLLWNAVEIGKPFTPSRATAVTLSDFIGSFRTRSGEAVLPREAWEMMEYLLEFRPLDSPSVLIFNDMVHVLSRLRIDDEPWIDKTEAEAVAQAERDERAAQGALENRI